LLHGVFIHSSATLQPAMNVFSSCSMTSGPKTVTLYGPLPSCRLSTPPILLPVPPSNVLNQLSATLGCCLQCVGVRAGDSSAACGRASGAPRLGGCLQVRLGQAARGSFLTAWICRHGAGRVQWWQQQAYGAGQCCCSSGRAGETSCNEGRREDACLSITCTRGG
jgi:hypothetical protein